MKLFPLDEHRDRVALVDLDEERNISYGELAHWGERLLEKIALPRALAFLFTQNDWRDVASYVSLANEGHAVCLLDARMDEQFQRELVAWYRPHMVMSHEIGEWNGYEGLSLEGQHILRRKQLHEAPQLHPDLTLLLSTSGTTGSPKMIRLSSQNLASNSSAIIHYLGITSKERAIASLPMHYSYGLSVLNTHLKAGAATLLTRKSILQADFWKLMHRHEATSFAGVPYTYAMLDRLNFESFDLPHLKTMTQAGGALAKELVLKFHDLMKRRGGRFFVMYGQTEATARIAYLPSEYLPEKAGAIGKSIPGGLLKLYEGAQLITEPHHEGELVYEGSNVMLGYAAKPEDLKEEDQLHGVLRTGDLGFVDEDGIFTLTGRLKRISKVYGYRINLDEIEKMLRPLADVAATSDDASIFLHFEGGNFSLMEQCVKLIADKYHLHYATFKCRSVEQLPRTASGKIDYKKL